ncbi:MAG: phosphatase PAP2 family protein [Bacteroidota bacterium]|nr:phosphatase PAP2 family protein [Bacteroidota bacterium]
MIEFFKYYDRALFLKINSSHSQFMDVIMWVVSHDFFIYPFIILFLFWHFKKASPRRALTMVLGIGFCVATADLSTNIVKHKVQRYRPSHNLEIMAQVHTVNDYHGGQFGFFSSHAANSFAVVTLLFLAAKTFMSNKYRYAFYLLPSFIIYSRIYLGVHYPSDVMVGAVWGILIGWLIFNLLTRFFLKEQKS